MVKRAFLAIWSLFRQTDRVLLRLCCGATVFGIFMIYSATRWTGSNRYVAVQGAALVLGIAAYAAISLLDLEVVIKRWKGIAAFNVIFILLLLTPLGVSDNTGNTAWLKFPFLPVSIGPAEVVKVTFIILLARQLQWLREDRRDLKSFSSALLVAGHTFLLAGLYFAVSGDMGNALMFFLIFMAMAFVSGVALRWFALLIAAVAGAFAAVWHFGLLPEYMRKRFLVVFDHSYDVRGAGWQQTRSLITLGSGGWFGQGYLHGTQTQSGAGAIPARHTDLIFAVIGEELGLIGALAAIALLIAIVIRILTVARQAPSHFHALVCVGIASMVAFQMIINVGMCLFVMPVIGLTLPFYSYGGSSVVTLFAAMGLVSSVKMRSVSRR